MTVLTPFSSATTILDTLLATACQQHVSDIHIQPAAACTIVRLRIHGCLSDYAMITHEQSCMVAARLKVLCGVDSTQSHIPQDGAVRHAFAQRSYDVRVSFFPSLYGEKVVLRLLGQGEQRWQLDTIGLTDEQCVYLKELAQQHHGFFLVTGPTGSGKTTTLYALLGQIDSSRRNVVTLEDPIEYRMAGITQTQVRGSDDRFSFAHAVRSLLRQDPDVALIGELRDTSTARSAIEAALTGHLVLSTLHTTQASSAPIRLREMGVPAYLIASSLSGVLAQRLVSTPAGRHLIAELFIPDERARQMMLHEATTAADLQREALRCGMVPLEHAVTSFVAR